MGCSIAIVQFAVQSEDSRFKFDPVGSWETASLVLTSKYTTTPTSLVLTPSGENATGPALGNKMHNYHCHHT